MKTQIELHSAECTRNGIKVNYVLYDESGDAIVSQTIPTEKLETYIVENDMNRYEFINYNIRNLECDGLDESYQPADEYLSENLNDVVLAYLSANLDKIAA